MSSDRRCGTIPSVTPNTTTRSHSRPFTRWIVLRVTPPSARSRWNARRSHASKRRRVGVEVGHLQQGLEVVEVRAAGAAGAVEQRHRRAEADVVAHRGEEVAGAGALRGERRQPVEVDGQVVELLGDLHVVDAGGGLAHVGDRTAPVEPLHRPLRQPSARPAVHLGEVGAADVLRVDRDAQVGQRRPHAEPREHALVEDRVDRHAGLRQRHVRRQQQRLHPRQHGGLARATRPARPASPAPRRPAPARRCRRRGSAPRSAPSSVRHGGPGPDLLRHPHPVVGEQRGGGLGDRRRAPVVHLEGVLGGAREVGGVVDEEPRVAADVPVDRLVVVADPEDVGGRAGGQPDRAAGGPG